MNAIGAARFSRTREHAASKAVPAQRRAAHEIAIAGATLLADPAGALYWAEERLLAIADLHLEKGSAFAKRGVLLPPYDTIATLARLAKLIERYRPALVVALGDSFHDGDGEIAGHLHPMARVARRGRGVARRCFAADSKRLVMPAFGAYAGGLNIRDRAIVGLFGALSFTAHLLGDGRLYAIPAARCLSD